MKKCKRCNSEMIETKVKISNIIMRLLLDLIVLPIIAIIIAIIPYEIAGKIAEIILICNALTLFIHIMALITSSYIRYECPKCKYAKQKIGFINMLIDILSDIF